jgi:beta-glucanase (GH16 family)
MLVSGAILALPSGAAAADTPNCGSDTLTTAGGTWQCTFADDFDGTTLNPANWVAQRTDTSGYTVGATACYVDSPNNISVSGGSLKLTARREPAPFTCTNPRGDFQSQWTSGMVTSWGGRFNQAFGRFEVRGKLSSPAVKGLQSSFWLWPVDSAKYGPRPAAGEIDIAEMYSQYPGLAVPYVHYNAAAPDPNVTNTTCTMSDLSAFHTYAVEWTASSLEFIYDGRTCLVDHWNPASPLSGSQPFDQPFFIALTQALGVQTNAFDPATTPLPATTEIDYVKVWKQLSGPPAPPLPPPSLITKRVRRVKCATRSKKRRARIRARRCARRLRRA